MPVIDRDLDWMATRLLIDVYDINTKDRYDRITRRLTNLYRELEPMKFRFTEALFFWGKDRKAGEVMEAPVGPYRSTIQGGRIAQFEEIPDPVTSAAQGQMPTSGPAAQSPGLTNLGTAASTLPPATLQQAPTSISPMSITGIQSGAFQAQLDAMRKKLADRLTKGLSKIDGAAEAGAAKMDAAVDGIVAKVDAEIEDKLQEFATLTNGGPA